MLEDSFRFSGHTNAHDTRLSSWRFESTFLSDPPDLERDTRILEPLLRPSEQRQSLQSGTATDAHQQRDVLTSIDASPRLADARSKEQLLTRPTGTPRDGIGHRAEVPAATSTV